MTTTQTTWIERQNLTVGDTAIAFTGDFGQDVIRLKVTKVTKTQITLSDGTRWMKKSGYQIGNKTNHLSEYYRQEVIEPLPPTPEFEAELDNLISEVSEEVPQTKPTRNTCNYPCTTQNIHGKLQKE